MRIFTVVQSVLVGLMLVEVYRGSSNAVIASGCVLGLACLMECAARLYDIQQILFDQATMMASDYEDEASSEIDHPPFELD